ncbi:hypothetical protein [Clostridium massiliamazoniense]|uniref:hypothetical protein n=1 Tax=Clostridium massiliamazoniense TaxID=1347366 RepID=UPI0006D7FD14|nr:hypothetical protein [Clostridium massiliamazoniense]
MANICFFDDDFYEIYENEEGCPLKKGYLLVKKKYFLFSIDPFPDEIINLSDNELENIFYPDYEGNNIFDKYFPPEKFNDFSVFGTGHAFTVEKNFEKINEFYSLIFHAKRITIFYDNKRKEKGIPLEEYNKIYKAFFFFSKPKKHADGTLVVIVSILSIISLICSIWKHNIYYLFLMLVFLYILQIRKRYVVGLSQKKINNILKEKKINYKLFFR